MKIIKGRSKVTFILILKSQCYLEVKIFQIETLFSTLNTKSTDNLTYIYFFYLNMTTSEKCYRQKMQGKWGAT